jgi:hypothetical protein
MAGKFYAVKKGKVPGIYTSWDACKSMVHGFPGAIKGLRHAQKRNSFWKKKKRNKRNRKIMRLSTVRLTVLLPSMDMADFS